MRLPFRRNRSAFLLALISTAFAGEAGAVAGWVDFTSGSANLVDAQGRRQALTKGDNLDKGQTVRTGENGRVQIRFTDGAYVSLQPNSEFAIKDYNFEGKTDGSERGLFALARGAMRTVTGLIGRVNKNRYQIATPTATIGIRGTGGLISVGPDGSTLVTGTSGIWTLSNPSGTLDVPAGVSAKAPSAPGQPPQQTTEKPSSGPSQPVTTQPPYSQADNRTSTGASASLGNPNPPLVSGPGYHVSYAYNEPPGSNKNSSGSLADAVFDTTGRLLKFSATNSATFNGTHQEFDTRDGIVAWGRWTGPIAAVDSPVGAIALNPNTNNGYHYVVGIPATGMPTTGSASFTMIGATAPTGQNGILAPGTFTGTFTVTSWSAGTISVGGTIAFPSAGFSYTYSGLGTFSAGSPAFTGSSASFSVAGQPAASAAGYGCTSGCTVLINGAFFGAGATHAGYAYMVSGASTNSVTGAAVFKQ